MRVPGKAAYRALDGDDDLEFEFYLAEKLGLIVADMRARMPQAEFVLWTRYYARLNQRQQVGLA